MGGFKGLFNIIWSNIMDTNKPINNKACANEETVVVLKDKNKKIAKESKEIANLTSERMNNEVELF